MEEIWKDINDFESFYQISNYGRVKSLSKIVRNSKTKNSSRVIDEKILKERYRKNGRGCYLSVQLCKYGIKKSLQVHRLVANAFISNPMNKPCVNHINGNKKDNRVDNLEWCTYSENQKHAIETGLFKDKCENNPMAKLKNTDIPNIRYMIKIGISQRQIASIYNVHFGTISNINKKITWKDIPD